MWKQLSRAVTESCAPARNWRWMLASFGIGAGFGIVAGLARQGAERASFSLQVAGTMVEVAVTFLVIAWIGIVAFRFVRSLRLRR
jgi:hypothetical protein